MASSTAITTSSVDGFDSSHLKGVINTNRDPLACELCSGPIGVREPYWNADLEVRAKSGKIQYPVPCTFLACCGKSLCNPCADSNIIPGQGAKCKFCFHSFIDIASIGALKKKAKRGQPWAQEILASRYLDGDGTTQSTFDALRWYRKAASNGHPRSLIKMSQFYLALDFQDFNANQAYCPRDLEKALEALMKAKKLDPRELRVNYLLVEVAALYQEKKEFDDSEQILNSLAEDDSYPDAFSEITCHLDVAGRRSEALNLCLALIVTKLEVTQVRKEATVFLALTTSYAMDLRIVVSTLLPYGVPTRLPAEGMFKQCAFENMKRCHFKNIVQLKEIREDMMQYLSAKRKECSECGTRLDRSNRLLCKQCKVDCYCSRACQKKHWNKKKGSHQPECWMSGELKTALASW